MKKILWKKIAAIVLTAIVAVSMLATAEVVVGVETVFAQEAEIVESGSCGENLTWTLDSKGLLTISGEGEMFHYYEGGSPWKEYSIKTVHINEGVTNIGDYAFAGCSSLTSIDLPEGVTSIGDRAFQYCWNLAGIDLPEGVTSIGDRAFYRCDILTGIDLPKGLTSIGDSAFGDSGLTSIEIPEGVMSIGDYAFESCSSLTSIAFSEGVMSIGDHVFEGCSSLTSIVLPNSLTSIGDFAFYNCSSLTGVDLPEGVTSIGDYTFWNCSNLASIILPEGVTSIGAAAFGYSGLTSIEIPKGVTSIGADAFAYCIGLTSIEIPEGVTSIGDSAFRGCSSLTGIALPEGVTSIGSATFMACSSLTSIALPKGVTSIGGSAFVDCTGLTSIELPESVTRIVYSAFKGCSSLTDVYYSGSENDWNKIRIESYNETLLNARVHYNDVFGVEIVESGTCGENLTWTLDSEGLLTISGEGEMPHYYEGDSPWDANSVKTVHIGEGVTSIGDYAFWGCSSLTSIEIPEGVTSIGDSAFWNCSSLTRIALPESVMNIGDSAFESCSSLTRIELSEGVTSIGYRAFAYCGHLTSIALPNSVTSIGDFAFEHCDRLIGIVLPEGVTSTGDDTFAHCYSLTSIVLPESVTSIGGGAFAHCYSLTSIVLPESVTSIGDFAFGYSGLTSIEIPDGVTSIGDHAFKYCSSVTSIKIPESVTSIGDYAFEYCSSLTSVELPDSVTSIGDYTFYNCDYLASIALPNSMTSIAAGMFWNCGNLTSIELPEGVTSIGDSAFWGCSSLTGIALPEGVTSIGHSAFCGCSSLTGIALPEGVTSIENSVFSGCSSLTDIELPEGLMRIGDHAFWGCSSLTNIALPEGVTSIGDCAFEGCSSLTSITLPEGVTSIGVNAFADCSSLTNIALPESVTSIWGGAFSGCSSLTDVYYSGSENDWNMINIGSNNDALLNARIQYGSDQSDAHHTSFVNAVAATCTNDGNIAYYYCSDCQKYFSDENGEHEITQTDTVVKATGHSWGAWKVTRNATISAEGQEERVCKNDPSHKQTRAIAKLIDINNAAVDGIKNLSYTGNARTLSLTVTLNGTALTKGTDYTVQYANNTNAGTATVTVTGKGIYGGSKAVNFTIAKAAVSGVTGPAAITLTYTGKAQKLITAGKVSGGTMQYSLDNKTWSTAIPTGTKAGSYKVYWKIAGDANHNNKAGGTLAVTIAKAAVSGVTGPTAITLTYTGKAQKLITAGKVSGGTMQYSLDNKTWSTAIPTGTKAGSYKVYWKIVGDANHSNKAGGTLAVTIAKAAVSVTTKPAAKSGLVYTGKAQKLITAGKVSGGTLQYSLDNKTWSTAIPTGTKAGSYKVYWKIVGDANHSNKAGGTLTVKIAKAAVTVTTKPAAKSGLVYTGKAQKLITAGKVSGGTMQYSLDNKTWGKAIPTATKAGSYKVYWKIVGDANHNNKAGGTLTVKIAKAKNPLTIATSSKTYKRSALTAAKTFTIGAAKNQGKVTYTLDSKAKAANIKVSAKGKVTVPKNCKKGTYKITVKAAGNTNYKAASKTVTIVVK